VINLIISRIKAILGRRLPDKKRQKGVLRVGIKQASKYNIFLNNFRVKSGPKAIKADYN